MLVVVHSRRVVVLLIYLYKFAILGAKSEKSQTSISESSFFKNLSTTAFFFLIYGGFLRNVKEFSILTLKRGESVYHLVEVQTRVQESTMPLR